MRIRKHVTKSEEELLKQLRGYDKDECIEIWNSVKCGALKKFPRNFWQNYDHRKQILEDFVKTYRKNNNGGYPQNTEFIKNRLRGLLKFYGGSSLSALVEAGFTNRESENYDALLDETPWLIMARLPQRYWDDGTNVRKAVDWLAKVTTKEATKLLQDDFKENYLSGLLDSYSSSPVTIIRRAGYEVKELERSQVTKNYWVRANITNHIRKLVEELGKPVSKITAQDFANAGLGGMLVKLGNSPTVALQEAGYEFDLTDCLKVPHNYWNNKENRAKAIRTFVSETGKSIGELKWEDFRRGKISGLVSHYYNGSYKRALREAGLLPEMKEN